jgi:transposase-like protein
MYVQGVSTRRVKRIVEELFGMEVSSSQVSRAAAELDEMLEAWRSRELGRYRYILLDAQYEKVRQGGQVLDAAGLPGSAANSTCSRTPGSTYRRWRCAQRWRPISARTPTRWAETALPEGLTVFALPASHRRRLRTTNLVERLNVEIRRHTRVARRFPNEGLCLRLVSAVRMEISGDW